jgi:hypothetical protein
VKGARHTEEQIAERVGMGRTGVETILTRNESFRFTSKPGELYEIEDEDERWNEIERRNREAAAHQSDFDPPLYNVWKQQEKTKGPTHFGNSEVRWLD